MLEKFRENIIGDSPIVFPRKAFVDDTYIQKLENICKSIVGIDASQLYPYSMCQPMPTGLCKRWDIDQKTSRFTLRLIKTRIFENMAVSYFQRTRPECKNESFYTTSRQQKNDCFSVDGFCSHCNAVFEAMGFFTTCVPVKKFDRL